MKHVKMSKIQKKSIFISLFIPFFVVLILQAIVFYVAAVYGGIEDSLNQNAADILSERLISRKNEIETVSNQEWLDLDRCSEELNVLYAAYSAHYGIQPLTQSTDNQIAFLAESSSVLIRTLRRNSVNGIFLIVNDQKQQADFAQQRSEEKIGICLRDLDQKSTYTGTEDIMVERAPSAVIDQLGCSLDSWWEARYTFHSEAEGAYYYNPLRAAWENPDAEGEDIAYFAGAHRISGSDQYVVSYSLPLMDAAGYPYAVLGVELTTSYLGSLLPSKELGAADKSCYVLALKNQTTGVCMPIVGSGSTYNRCLGNEAVIATNELTKTGGFHVTGRDQTLLYGTDAVLGIYNNNNPFENMQLTLIAFIEEKELFSYIANIKNMLALVTVFSLLLGLCGLYLVSRQFSKPITALAKKVQTLPPRDGFTLGRLGITEIDQLVDSIEELNRNASRNIARTEFFSRMSHDMRTPMNAIISFSSQELLENADEAQKEAYLNKIHSSGTYLLGLINEVLDMTKIESNKIDLQYSPISTTKLWETTISIVEQLAQKKNIQFRKNISMEDAVVMADEQHLSQIVMNLLSNAVKFTPENGTVYLEIKTSTNLNKADDLLFHVTVTDSGIGMSEAFMRNLYHPFEQENENREGTGLGLSIAKKLIDLMGGTIACTSRKNEGTTFVVDFTLHQCSDEEILQEQKQEKVLAAERKQTEQDVLQGKRLLVCEDHPINTEIVVRLLERVGIQVDTVENGKLGLDKFVASEIGYYQGILMDIRMPVMDGLETAHRIRSLKREDAASIPIIAMTANAFIEDVRASREAGMNAHLSKPIDPQKLYETLQEMIH